MMNTKLCILCLLLLIGSACSGINNSDEKVKKMAIYFQQGTQDLLNKDYTQALRNLLQAKSLGLDDSDLYNNLGMAYYFKGDMKLAVTNLQQSLERNPQNGDAKNNLASLYFRNHEIAKAQIEYDELLKDLTYEHHYRTHNALAQIYITQGFYHKALNSLKRSIAEKEDFCPSHLLLGSLYTKLGDKKEALSHFQQAGKGTCYNLPEPLYYQGLALKNLNQPAKAKDKFLELRHRFPNNHFSNLALRELQKLSEVNQSLEQANTTEKSSDTANSEKTEWVSNLKKLPKK
jgi:type IV pilus assembly protein PilF